MPKCKDCGRQATDEQVLSAASKVRNMDALMKGVAPWQCTLCRAKEVALRQSIGDEIRAELKKLRSSVSANSLQLLPTEALIAELFKRYPHAIAAFRSIPVEGVNDAMEGLYHSGDYRMCQGLASGLIGKMERDIVAAVDRRRSQMEEAQD